MGNYLSRISILFPNRYNLGKRAAIFLLTEMHSGRGYVVWGKQGRLSRRDARKGVYGMTHESRHCGWGNTSKLSYAIRQNGKAQTPQRHVSTKMAVNVLARSAGTIDEERENERCV